ncbi:MAG TPA: tRNA guanosine(34) transglycosylase Tgt [Planctomycetota bacterium]|nr:tRNA guanosine(34) transglycosylase Tgt [Planctomycetota bacterium]
MPAVTYELKATDGRSRAGVLRTPHGAVETPCFMAVATLGGLKGVTAEQAERLGQGVMLGNTYHLALRPGAETVHRLGGLHAFAGWNGPMLTDSGGYQVFSLAANRVISDHGVVFRSHLDGTKLEMTPESSVRVQRLLGADIIMAFDEFPPAGSTHDVAQRCNRRTADWLARCVQAWRADDGTPGGAATQALYGIVQGGTFADLRAASARDALAHDLPGYAIGGLAVGEAAAERNRVLDETVPLLPTDRPRYLMGVGTPLDLVEAVARGVDQFDCVLPTRMGRHGMAYHDDGPLRLKRVDHALDRAPIDADTPSDASRHSRGYLNHLLKSGEVLGGTLLSLHNLAYYNRLMRRMRAAILAGAFAAFADAFRARYRDDMAGDEAIPAKDVG